MKTIVKIHLNLVPEEEELANGLYDLVSISSTFYEQLLRPQIPKA